MKKNHRDVTRNLAERAAATDFAVLPVDVKRLVRHCLLDWTGVALAGAAEPLVRLLVEDAQDGDESKCATLIGRSLRTGLANAVLINGATGHALDYDDGSAVMVGHPSVVLWPGVLALAERRRASGAQLIEAYVAGCETAARVGRLLAPDHYRRGFHATGTIGAFGAAAAAGRLLGLDGVAMARAFGIAGTRAAGLRAAFGTMCKPLHAGHAAWIGASAARLAARGFDGPCDILDNDRGFAMTHSADFNADVVLGETGDVYHIRAHEFKWHAACYGAHPAMDLIRQLRDAHGIEPQAIRRVMMTVPADLEGVCLKPEPVSGLEIKFSLRMLCAFVLARIDTASPGSFTDARASDHALIGLRNRIEIRLENGRNPARAEIELIDDRCVRGTAQPASMDIESQERALLAKFDALSRPVLGSPAASQLVRAISTIERCNDAAELLAMTVPADS